MNLKQLLGICEHKWNLIREDKVFALSDPKKEQRGIIFILKCEKCGKIKTQRHMV